MGDDELAPEAGKRNSGCSFVNRFGIRLAPRKVKFLLCCADVDPISRQSAVIDLTVRHRKVALGLNRDIVRPKYRISPAVHFIDRDGHSAVAVSIFEREIHPDLGLIREFIEVELAGGDHDLPLGAIDDVAIDVDPSKSVVRSQPLGVLQCRGILLQILSGQRRYRDYELTLFDRRPV